jgi:vacuolar-type H+-ATPase subunit F/Vma7
LFGLAAFGTEEFVLGFELAGIKNSVVAGEDLTKQIKDFMQSREIGVVIIDEHTLNEVDSYTRKEIEDSVSPVFIALSEKAEDESLRRMIKKSIGVDLWEK